MTDVLCTPWAGENPYQDLLARALAERGFQLRSRALTWRIEDELLPSESLVHLHWLAPLLFDSRRVRTALRLMLFARGLHRLQKRGVPFVWTIHNLYEHGRKHPSLERRLRRWLARHAAALIVHGPSAADLVRREYRISDATKVVVVPHGHYIDAYPGHATRLQARHQLGLDPQAPTLLFLGQIRRDKGALELIEAVKRLPSGLQLVVAGRPQSSALEDEVRARARGAPGIHLQMGFVPAADAAVLLAACDLFVLPHREVLTSGSAILAMSFGRACVAPRTAYFSELFGEQGAFLFDPAHPDALELALHAALADRPHWDEMGRRNRAFIEPFGWGRVAEQTAAVYERAMRSVESA